MSPDLRVLAVVSLLLCSGARPAVHADGGVRMDVGGDDLIFADDFESGSTAAWYAVQDGDADVAVVAAAGMDGTSLGLAVTVDDTVPVWLAHHAGSVGRYRARFYFDPSGLTVANDGERVKVLQLLGAGGQRRAATLVLRRSAGAYWLRAKVHLDDDTWVSTGFHPLASGPDFVELHWVSASGANADDGSFELWIGGVSVAALGGLDNDMRNHTDLDPPNFVRIGVINVKPGATGTLHFDQFESRIFGYIGP